MEKDFLFYAVLFICIGVVAVLSIGLGIFAKGGKDAGERSNKMMRYRIIAQAVAVFLITVLVFLNGNGGN